MMLYAQHTEGRVNNLLIFLLGYIAYAYYTQTLLTKCSAAVILLSLGLIRYVAKGPRAKYLPENASSTEYFLKRKLADRPYAGRVAVVTGANRNIGFFITRSLAHLGAHVIMLDMEEQSMCDAAMDQIRKEDPEASLTHIRMNLAQLDTLKDVALQIVQTACKLKKVSNIPTSLQKNSNTPAPQNQQVIDYFVNNAGCAGVSRTITREGFDFVYQVNHLGPFILTESILPYLNRRCDGGARLMNTASCAHTWWHLYPFSDEVHRCVTRCLEILNDPLIEPYPTNTGYNLSKFSNLVHASHLAKRFAQNGEGDKIITASTHPGAVFSNIWRFIPYPFKYATDALMAIFFKTSFDGHQTALHVLTAPHVISGQFYADCQPFRPRSDCALDEKVWDAVDDYCRKAVGKWM